MSRRTRVVFSVKTFFRPFDERARRASRGIRRTRATRDARDRDARANAPTFVSTVTDRSSDRRFLNPNASRECFT